MIKQTAMVDKQPDDQTNKPQVGMRRAHAVINELPKTVLSPNQLVDNRGIRTSAIMALFTALVAVIASITVLIRCAQ